MSIFHPFISIAAVTVAFCLVSPRVVAANREVPTSSTAIQLNLPEIESSIKNIKFGRPRKAYSAKENDPLLNARLSLITSGLSRGRTNFFQLVSCPGQIAALVPDSGNICFDHDLVAHLILTINDEERSTAMIDFMLAHEVGHAIETRMNLNQLVIFKAGTAFNISSFSEREHDGEINWSTLRKDQRLLFQLNVWHSLTDAIGIALLRKQGLPTSGASDGLKYLAETFGTQDPMTMEHLSFRMKNVRDLL